LRYVLDIPPELVERVNKLLQGRSDKYRSPQDFVVAAIQNQLYLESQEAGWPATGTEKFDVSDSSPPATQITSAIQLLQLSIDLAGVKTVPLSDLHRPSYLWGQYNRVFPVKIVTRVAANLARIKGDGYFPLGELHEKSAQIAGELGKAIEKADKSMGRKRGTIISAGLPIGRREDKAKLRFKNQFVGYLASNKTDGNNHQFKIEGAAPALKFLDIKNEKDSIVAGITDFGLKFTCLPNPIIDAQDFSTPFSSEEIDFLLDHIASQLPDEARMIQLILSCIKQGVASPEGLNMKMKSFNPKWKASEPTTMRAGVVSRISELGLLGREKDGVKVTYRLTELGEKYLARLGGLEWH